MATVSEFSFGVLRKDSGKTLSRIRRNSSAIKGLMDLDYAESIFSGSLYQTREFVDRNLESLIKNKEEQDRIASLIKVKPKKVFKPKKKAKKWRPESRTSMSSKSKKTEIKSRNISKFKDSSETRADMSVISSKFPRSKSFYSTADKIYPSLKIYGNPKRPVYYENPRKTKGSKNILLKAITKEQLNQTFKEVFVPKGNKNSLSIRKRRQFERREEINSFIEPDKFKDSKAVYIKTVKKRRNTLVQIDSENIPSLPLKVSTEAKKILTKCKRGLKRSQSTLDKGYDDVLNSTFLMKHTLSRMVKGRDYMLEKLLSRSSKKMFNQKGFFSYNRSMFINNG